MPTTEEGGARPPVSPAAAAFLAVLVAGTLAAFVWMGRRSAERAAGDPLARAVEVRLGEPFQRPFAGGEAFMARVVLQLDAPDAASRDELRRAVEARVDALRSAVNQDVVYARPESLFREGPAAVEKLKVAIRDRVNRELQAAGLGADVVRDVSLPDLVLPAAAP